MAHENENAQVPDSPKGRSKWLNILLFGVPISSAAALFVAGIVFWGGFNTAMEATNTMEFCISCHEMKDNVYNEYTKTIHFQNRTGVRATCSDCHVPDPWVHKVVRKVQASNELLHKVLGSIDTPEKFDAKRLTLARNVWHSMKSTDSRECRNCHDFQSMAPEFQRPRARKQHLSAFEAGQTCIDCHKGIAHKGVRDLLDEEELEKLEKPNPAFIREVPASYLASLERIEAKEAQEAAEAQEKQEAAEKSVQERIDAAVTAALAAKVAEIEAKSANESQTAQATTETQPAASAGSGSGIDWGGVTAKTVTLFYPGQASFDWVETGKDHGGARAFSKLGDRCSNCHAKEVRDMGAKIVSGEKAEPTPIPGKRGHVDVAVQAVHDNDNLYMRFQWKDDGHKPVPFADGGKLDPNNQVKLAMMIAGPGIDLVDQAGCWATCHHDSRYMPDHPTAEEIAGAAGFGDRIDVKDGITKYLADTRTKIEIKGRRNKKRGGWDKLKSAEDITQLNSAGSFMDLLRYRSGGDAQNGHVLAERVMTDEGKLEATGQLAGGVWTVEMIRPLKAGAAGDVSLEAGTLYTVGFALHDDFSNARFHHVSLEFRLGLDNPEAEINVEAK
jgi:cytochrome c-type protein NapC